MMDRQYDTLRRENPDATTQQRWFNETGDRIARAMTKGYLPVLKDGQVQRQAVGPGITAILMEVPKVKRNLDGFFKHHKGMGAAVKARIIRLNPTIEEGALIRGWHPKKNLRYRLFVLDQVGKGDYIQTYGRAAYEKMKANGWVVKDGKREYIMREGVMGLARAFAPNDSIVVQDFMRRKR